MLEQKPNLQPGTGFNFKVAELQRRINLQGGMFSTPKSSAQQRNSGEPQTWNKNIWQICTHTPQYPQMHWPCQRIEQTLPISHD